MELVNRSEKLRDRAFNVAARKWGNWQAYATIASLGLEAHTIRTFGEERDCPRG